ncbi:hypothetical protein [Micromonospora hortensis]|uniref:hypothetical protein n=1 Tax=Micromonospora hortensis TaxID=2911209 RepID=UPI001EE89A7B|nr:hypothetical protein [Micromonospora hortensis]MCG5449827.1 hypothetical protein [Micromonospora hortensis]
MGIAGFRSNMRSLIGLAAVCLAVAAVISVAPNPAVPERDWRPPAGYVLADTVSLDDEHTLRLWTGPSGWYVESMLSGRHQAAVGAGSGGDQSSVSEVLNGLVGQLSLAGATAVAVGSPTPVRARVHSGVFLVSTSVIRSTDRAVPVTPLDVNGKPLAPGTLVEVAGRG